MITTLNPKFNQSPADRMLLTLGFGSSTIYNVRVQEDISSRDLVYTIMGKSLRQWQFIQNIFEGHDDVELTLVDGYVDTPFRCVLVSLFIRQLRQLLGIRYTNVRLLVSPLQSEHPQLIGLANDPFDTTTNRNRFLEDAFCRIVGNTCFRIVSKRNHIRKRDITLTTRDYTLIIKSDQRSSLSVGWRLGSGSCSFMTADMLLDCWNMDIPCYNQAIHEYDKCGMTFTIELIPNER